MRFWPAVAGGIDRSPVSAGQSFRIQTGTVHRMEAVTDIDILEASTPELDDVVRIQDRYGRS
jgi:hypothetical protein